MIDYFFQNVTQRDVDVNMQALFTGQIVADCLTLAPSLRKDDCLAVIQKGQHPSADTCAPCLRAYYRTRDGVQTAFRNEVIRLRATSNVSPGFHKNAVNAL